MMKVVKTDRIVPVTEQYTSMFDGLDVEFVARPCDTEDELIEACADADAILTMAEKFTARVIAELKKCKIISRFGAGVDTVDVAAAKAVGIVVANVPHGSDEEVSSHAVAMMLALTRRLPQFDKSVRKGGWSAKEVGAGMHRTGAMTVGLIGLGNIGGLAAQKLAPFKFTLWGFDPHVSDERFDQLSVERRPFEDIIAAADILTLHVPLTDDTHNMISARRLASMKPGAILVNVSRGGLVDENALAQCLIDGKLGGAGIDVFSVEPLSAESPLRNAPNLLMSPHAAWCAEEAFHDVIIGAYDNVVRVLTGKEPSSSV